MLLQTNSYIVPKDKRAEHARLLRRFRQALARLGCDHFEVYEQVGANWSSEQSGGRFVQIMRFRDRRHQIAVQTAERNDPVAQALIAEFCQLINFPYQQQNNLFAVGYYTSCITTGLSRQAEVAEPQEDLTTGVGPTRAPQVAEADQTFAAPTPATVSPSDQPKPDRAEAAQGASPFAEESAWELRPVDDIATGESKPPVPEVHPQPAPVLSDQSSQYETIWQEPGGLSSQPPVEPGDEVCITGLSDPPRGGNGKYSTRSPAAQNETDETVASHHAEDAALRRGEGMPAGALAPAYDIGQVLDAGLIDDADLDVALPAELIDETTSPQPHRRGERRMPHDPIDMDSRHA